MYKINLVFASALLLSGNNYYKIRQFWFHDTELFITKHLLFTPATMCLSSNTRFLLQENGKLKCIFVIDVA